MARKRGSQQARRQAQRRRLLDGLQALVAHGTTVPFPLGEATLQGLGAEMGMTPAETVALFKEAVAAGEVRVVPQAGGRGYIRGVGALVEEVG